MGPQRGGCYASALNPPRKVPSAWKVHSHPQPIASRQHNSLNFVRELPVFPAVFHPQHKRLHDDALKSSKLRQPGRYCFLADLVESRKTTLFCSDFRIRAYFGHYYGENRFSKALLHNITGIMLFQLDSSRISHEICSSNTPLGEPLCNMKKITCFRFASDFRGQIFSRRWS